MVGVVAGCAEYFLGDHWLSNGATDHYLYPPLWFNVTISAISGLLASAVAWALLEAVNWMRRNHRQRSNP
jgi:uncharacterized membrane protein YccC